MNILLLLSQKDCGGCNLKMILFLNHNIYTAQQKFSMDLNIESRFE